MIQNTRYLLGKILMFFNQLSFIGKADYCKLQVLLFSQKQNTFFIYPKKLIIFKGFIDAIFSLPLNATQTNLLSRFCTRHKSNKSEEKMMLRRCATAIAYCLDRSSFRMQTIYRVSNCPSNIQSRKKTKKFCGNQYSISI